MNTPFTKKILEKYLEGRCTVEEIEWVEQWYASFDNELPLFEDEKCAEALELQEAAKTVINELISHSKQQSNNEAGGDDLEIFEISTTRRFLTFTRVAAAILIILTTGILLYYMRNSTPAPIANAIKPGLQRKNAIVPGGSKALLTLADGSTIILDSAGSGALAIQGNTKVVKLADGRIIYDASQKVAGGKQQVAYNVLSTPRAAQYELILPDGTKVWLNAASSIKYPTAFTGKERVVEITGEVYFEVAKVFAHHSGPGNNKQEKVMPFRVKAKGMDVEVFGTHFNVNAYDEEQTIRTTLLEGSVKVISGSRQVFIKPGEQAKLYTSGALNIEHANLSETIAWKNGLFQFENASIQTVMRQVARWYDVEVVYEGQVTTDRFQGKLYRNTDISQLLKILELSGARFKIEGKKIIVQ